MSPRYIPSIALAGVLAVAGAFSACETPAPVVMRPPIPEAPERDRAVAAMYPTLNELYQGAQGIYRGCGPNGNVCHNARQYPNMNTLGALALSVNQPCNQLQDDPTRMDDWCERRGDTVRVRGERVQLAYIQRLSERTETEGSRWLVVVQGTMPDPEDGGLAVVRAREGRDDEWLIGWDHDDIERDPMRPNALIVRVSLNEEYKERILARAGIPAERDAIQFGDPNRNGMFGATLGNALIVAGHPERSYIIRRLTDPSAGPLMPLANCCFWSKESLRALWCWIANLRPDGSNAMDPIQYTGCPDGPVENIEYPTPGPTCENGGLCPVHTRTPVPDDPTWANVYGNILVSRCGGLGCHRAGETAGGLDLGTADTAYTSLLGGMTPRVVPGNPGESLLVRRLTQMCSADASCRRMPLNQPALPEHDLGVLTRWIELGARNDGMGSDAGVPFDVTPVDARSDAASEAGDGAPSDIVVSDTADVRTPDASDMGPADMGTPVMETGPEAGPEPAGMEPAPEPAPEPAIEPGPEPTVDAGSDAASDEGMDAAAE